MKWTGPRFALLLAVALTVWMWPSVFGGKVLLPVDILAHNPPHQPTDARPIHNSLIGDMIVENYPWHFFQREALAAGELPLWNSGTFCGHPLYTSGQASTFYPLNAIFLVLPLAQAHTVFVGLHLFLAGCFTWILLRGWNIGPFGSAVGGLVFAMSGYLTLHVVFPTMLGSAIWLPLILAWMHALAESCSGRSGGRASCPPAGRMPAIPGVSGSERDDPASPDPAAAGVGRYKTASAAAFQNGSRDTEVAVQAATASSAGGRRGRWLWLAGGPLLAMPALGGFFEIAFYTGMACLLLAAFLLVRLTRQVSVRAALMFTGKLVAAGGLALMFAAPQLLPFFEVMHSNIRAGAVDYDTAVAGALRPYELLNLVAPDALGNPAVHEGLSLDERIWRPIKTPGRADFRYWGPKNYVEVGFYFGLLPLAFALLSVRVRAGNSARQSGFGTLGRRAYFTVLIIVALAFALGLPVYRLFFYLVPGSEQVRTPFRAMLLVTMAGAGLAGLGAQYWYDRIPAAPSRRSRIAAFAVAAASLVLVLGVVASLYRPAWLQSLAADLLDANTRIRANFGTADDLAGFLWVNATRFAVFGLLACVAVAVAWWRKWSPHAAGVISLLAFGAIALDLGQASFGFNTHADPKPLHETPPLVQRLQADKGTFRIGRFGTEKVFYPNFPILYGLQDYGGYDSLILRDYAAFMEAIEPQQLLRYNIVTQFVRRSSLDSPLWPLLNIRYLLTTRQLRHADWERVPVEGNLNLYRIKPERELPRAFLVGHTVAVDSVEDAIARIKSREIDVFQAAAVKTDAATAAALTAAGGPTGTAEIESYRHSRVRIRTSCDRRQFLVLADVMYAGWNAYVDGERPPIYTTNGIFRGVSVPAGQHVVEFRFEPGSFRMGVGLAGVALLAILVVGLLPRR